MPTSRAPSSGSGPRQGTAHYSHITGIYLLAHYWHITGTYWYIYGTATRQLHLTRFVWDEFGMAGGGWRWLGVVGGGLGGLGGLGTDTEKRLMLSWKVRDEGEALVAGGIRVRGVQGRDGLRHRSHRWGGAG